MTPERAKALEAVAEAARVWCDTPLSDNINEEQALVKALAALDALPAEVDALRAERDTLRARVARLEELVRSAYAEGWQDSRIDEYDTAADRWESAAARAALSAETP